MSRLSVLVLSMLATGIAMGQSFSVSIPHIDFSGLPRITVTVCAEQNGELLRGLDASSFRLRENGRPFPVTARCPDPLAFNSVALVLDNSGSMSPVMPKLIEAAGRLVDSLDNADECAIVTFGRQTAVRQDFTTDRLLLKSVLAGLVAEGGTPLFDASLLALENLANRTGNRVAVIITDGEDNLSASTDADVIARALQINARLYTIAFSISEDNQRIMRNMATSTGGLFFSVVRPSELTEVYEKIAADITERCCRIEYTSDNCVDTLRFIDIIAIVAGDSAAASSSFISPSRPDFMTIKVEAPESLAPFESGMAWISCDPVPTPQLELTMAFTLVYDEDLVDVNPRLPFTLGTLAQNQVVEMSKVGTGRLRFVFSRIKPVAGTNRMLGVPLQGLLADSSRKVRIGIEDVVVEGCPVDVSVVEDSVAICQCLRPLAVEFDSLTIKGGGGDVVLPLRVTAGIAEGSPLLLDVLISLPDGIEILATENGNMFAREALSGTRTGSGQYRLLVDAPSMPLRATGVLAYLRLNASAGKSVASLAVSCDSARLWQVCCPKDTLRNAATVLIDGYCEPLLSRRAGRVSVTMTPDPMKRSSGSIVLRVRVPESLAGRSFALDIVNMLGVRVRSFAERLLPVGESSFVLNASDLNPGAYVLFLRSGDEIAARRFRVIE